MRAHRSISPGLKLPFTRTVANGLDGRPLIRRRLYRHCEEIRIGHLIDGQDGCRSDAHTKRIFVELNSEGCASGNFPFAIEDSDRGRKRRTV
jgi:hypothetical protein